MCQPYADANLMTVSILLMSDLAAEIVTELAMKEVDWLEFSQSSQDLINSTRIKDITGTPAQPIHCRSHSLVLTRYQRCLEGTLGGL